MFITPKLDKKLSEFSIETNLNEIQNNRLCKLDKF